MAISTVPAPTFRLPEDLMLAVANTFADTMATRRSVRDFSPDPVPMKVIEAAIRAAATAPSGANIQPWRFVVIADPGRKRRPREAAEVQEREFYTRRATPEWVIPVGYPAEGARVPDISRKPLDEILVAA